MPIKTIIERIKTLPASWQGKFNRRRVIIILVAILVLLGLVFALANIQKIQIERKVTPLPSPSPTPVEEEITAPSAYATDSAILAIEENLETLEKDILETDLYETGLNPPVLDMEVSFEEK